MEFTERIQGLEADCPISIWDRKRIFTLSPDHLEAVRRVVDGLGRLSASAQGLRGPITSLDKLWHSDHILYIASERKSCEVGGHPRALGILKTGRKKLFVRRADDSSLREIDPICVLDFYVCERFQRTGIGKMLFDTFLQHEGTLPERCGYDRPSPKFLKFLDKYYQLSGYVAQLNNFVVFNRYFEFSPETTSFRLKELSRKHVSPLIRPNSPGNKDLGKGEVCYQRKSAKPHIKPPYSENLPDLKSLMSDGHGADGPRPELPHSLKAVTCVGRQPAFERILHANELFLAAKRRHRMALAGQGVAATLRNDLSPFLNSPCR